VTVDKGEIVGLIGESGSGKTTAVRSLIGLLDRNVRVIGGTVRLGGTTILAPGLDRTHEVRGGQIGTVFQGASRSLNPLLRIRTQMREVLRRHRPDLSRADGDALASSILARLGLADPDRVLRSYPHQLSGGMRQRVAIALAVVTAPGLVLADECTTALDVTTQAEVVALLRELAREREVGMLFVTHDLLLASDICDRITVMYAGQAVETGPAKLILTEPAHPYTNGLLDSVPSWRSNAPPRGIDGAPPVVEPDVVGCRFAPRCPRRVDDCTAADVAWTPTPNAAAEAGYRCLFPVTRQS
jgi:oligopeptide/dipeptide ABC transporter ATP-binding protein